MSNSPYWLLNDAKGEILFWSLTQVKGWKTAILLEWVKISFVYNVSIFDTQPPNLRPENLGCGSLKTDVKKVKVTSKHNSILLEYNLLDSTNLLYTNINICSHLHVWRTSSEWILGWVQSTCSSGTNITQIWYWVWNNCGYKNNRIPLSTRKV